MLDYVQLENHPFKEIDFKGTITNNRVERLHGAVHEHEKVMHGLKRLAAARPLMEAYRIWYITTSGRIRHWMEKLHQR